MIVGTRICGSSEGIRGSTWGDHPAAPRLQVPRDEARSGYISRQKWLTLFLGSYWWRAHTVRFRSLEGCALCPSFEDGATRITTGRRSAMCTPIR
jgi:hypothetical protein